MLPTYEDLIQPPEASSLLEELTAQHLEFLATKKTCRMCKEEKPRSEFSKHSHSTDGRDSRCTECKNSQRRLTQGFRKEHPIPNDYTCPLCHRSSSRWHLDHCHKTEEPRGYLCPSCNASLGGFQDNPEILRRAIQWIEDNGNIQVPKLNTRPPRHLL